MTGGLPRKTTSGVKLRAPRGGGSAIRQCFAARKGRYLFQIASLNPALKGGACREAYRPTTIPCWARDDLNFPAYQGRGKAKARQSFKRCTCNPAEAGFVWQEINSKFP